MCKILVEAGCDIAHIDTANKMASHYAKKYTKNDTFDYLTSEFQNLKDQKRITGDCKLESNAE